MALYLAAILRRIQLYLRQFTVTLNGHSHQIKKKSLLNYRIFS